MSARDDYPYFPNPRTHAIERRVQYDAMCDEIDRLRDEIDALKIMYRADQMVRDAVNSLMRELTAHADAMSVAIKNICSAMDDELDEQIRNADGCAEAYDNFVKEC